MFRLARGLSPHSYRREWLIKDIVAGIVLSTLLVPQGMAYAELAGLPPITGLYTSILCLLGYAVFGPSRILVARQGGQAIGYAASQPYRDHPGFLPTVEVSIALDPSRRRQGVGTALYRALLRELAAEPVHVALAGIVLPNEASVALHRKLGFREVGVFHEYAVKNGQYLSSVWMERQFGTRGDESGEERYDRGV